MPDFAYTARGPTGDALKGTVSASDQTEALAQLARQNLFPTTVKEVAERGRRAAGGGKVSSTQLAPFYAQLGDLLSAGVPLLRSLKLIEDQTANPTLQKVIEDVRTQVADGRNLGESLRRHPRTFAPFVVSLVEAGEEGSFVEDVLQRLAAITSHQNDLRAKVIGAMIYPAFLLTFGAAVVVAMLTYFVPMFEPIFDRMRAGGGLPGPTQLLLTISDVLRSYWVLVAAGAAALAFGAAQLLRSEGGRRALDSALVKEWKVGRTKLGPGAIFRDLAVSRFCRVLGTMLANGVAVLRSMEIARNAAGNAVIADAIGRASEQLTGGKSLAQPMRSSGQFSAEVVEMVAVGEESNRLEAVLVDVAEVLEKRVQRRLDLIVRMVEPVMLLGLAAVVTFIVAALLLPILQSSTLV